ncbi:MAG TPA: carboxypeptidase-like regulatory domain-containing protein [Planctomicrobium sp.]|nr:carboxypeptidase-like regulatory domain-containing protein [Planctomicrobium sp.]
MFPHLRSVCFDLIQNTNRRLIAVAIAGLMLSSPLLVGCSKETEPMGIVLGVVTVQGKVPSDGLRLSFFNPMTGHGANGRTDQDGSFRIRRPLPVGNYKLLVDRMIPDDPEPRDNGDLAELKIDNAYANDLTTPLAFDVTGGENQLEIDLQGPAAKKSSRR